MFSKIKNSLSHSVSKFVCVDGPEFDAHQDDFDEMRLRLNGYKEIEKRAEDKYLKTKEK